MASLPSLPWLGPLLVAIGAWCALGQLSVLSPNAPSIRMADPASLWWIPVLWGAASLVPAWRHTPATATPALLSTIAWWPVPLPALGLVWTGRLAWVPVGLAIASAVVVGRRDEAGEIPRSTPLRSAAVAGLVTLVALGATAWWIAPRLPGGDEPHYLIITQSLLHDGDLRIANNHDARQYLAYFPGTIRPDKIRDGQNGEVYSIHAPGTSALVLPAFAAFGYRGAQGTIMLLAAATGGLVWLGAWLVSGDRRAAWFAWTLLATSTTFLIQGVTIFPDGPGAFLTAAVVVMLLTPAPWSRWMLVTSGACLAFLPWLHTRFAVLAIALGVLVAVRIWTQSDGSLVRRARDLAWGFVVPVVSASGWFAYFRIIYGTFNPSAPYGSAPEASWTYVPGGLVALLFDQQFGLLMYSPAFALAAWGLRARRTGNGSRLSGPLLAVTALYLIAVATYWMWWAGVPATPARFTSAVLPVVAIVAGRGWAGAGARSRAVWLLLLIVSITLTVVVIGAGRGTLAWNYRMTPRASWLDWLGSVTDLARGWPSFFWRLTAGDVASERHFATHVALWLACWIGAVAAMVAGVAARVGRPGASGVRAAWTLGLALMAALQCGWWWNSVDGIDATGSQLALMRDVNSGAKLVRIAPLSVRAEVKPTVHLRPTRADADDGSPVTWLPLRRVPAGEYALALSTSRPTVGTLSLERAGAPAIDVDVRPTSRQTATFALTGEVERVTFRPDDGLRPVIRALELIWTPTHPSKP